MAACIYVLFWFDVEDFITPESDDALKGIVEVMDSLKVRGSFKLVGEKVRAMERRGRHDIFAALRNHEIGYHTDLHSVHPTVAEYLEGLGWEEGVEEFVRREGRGFEEVRDTFGVTPTCYGQPGSSWAPQVYPALRSWGVPVYLDETDHIGLDDRPFWYCGMLNILRLRENATRFDPNQGRKGLEAGMQAFDAIYRRLSSLGGGVVSIWYHPCEYATYEFWDAVNFARGRNPERASWVLPRVKPRGEMERGIGYFYEYVRHIVSYADVRTITASEAYELYADDTGSREFTLREAASLAKDLGPNLTYQQVGDLVLSPAEAFYLVISFLCEALRRNPVGSTRRNILEALEGFTVRVPGGIYGPTRRTEGSFTSCDPRTFLDACTWSIDFIHANGRIPDAIPLGKDRANPGDFLATAAALLASLLNGPIDEAPSEGLGDLECITLVSGHLELEREVIGEGVWRWVIFPEGFDAPGLIELARLQTWSLKPAWLRSEGN